MLALLLAACSPGPSLVRALPEGTLGADTGARVDSADPGDSAASGDSAPSDDSATDPTAGSDGGPWGEYLPSGACGFTYDAQFPSTVQAFLPRPSPWSPRALPAGDAEIQHLEPLPPGTWFTPAASPAGAPPTAMLTMPSYSDDMPLFDRAGAWSAGTRCYELPAGAIWLTEEQAYTLWKGVAEATTGVSIDTGSGKRTVVGVRGAYPGTFTWHGNAPDVFNDTLVLLWADGDGKHVREFPVNTDTGDYDFGTDGASSLRADRRYFEQGGWHRGSYQALTIAESGYHVTDDTNHNGHWDSDRNGWLPPSSGEDHERTGTGHNIHVASVDAPLGQAHVGNWSAGCQTIPGMANWTEFITHAWPGDNVDVQYFLVDARDVDPAAFGDTCTPDGTHACPLPIPALPFHDHRDTSAVTTRDFDVYNCSSADESGPEVVYLLRIDDYGSLALSLTSDSGADVDVYLLDGDDPDACLDRDDTDLTWDVSPGRYLVVADTYVSGGTELVGGYTLDVSLR